MQLGSVDILPTSPTPWDWNEHTSWDCVVTVLDFNKINLQARGQGLLQLLSLLFVRNLQGVEESWASHLIRIVYTYTVTYTVYTNFIRILTFIHSSCSLYSVQATRRMNKCTVYTYSVHTLNLWLSAFFLILTLLASFLLAFSRKSLISLISLGILGQECSAVKWLVTIFPFQYKCQVFRSQIKCFWKIFEVSQV